MSFKAGTVVANETCGCGAHIEVFSGTGWLDSLNVKEQLDAWRKGHRHTPSNCDDAEATAHITGARNLGAQAH